MVHHNRISPDLKAQILQRIKEGLSVAQAAKDHGIHESTIYNWLSANASPGSPTLREMNALRKENAFLKSLIGDITVELSRSQKKR